jgi:hypothetical protein
VVDSAGGDSMRKWLGSSAAIVLHGGGRVRCGGARLGQNVAAVTRTHPKKTDNGASSGRREPTATG